MEVCCPDCNMSFPSHSLLSKHVTQFCVGPSTAIDQLQVEQLQQVWRPEPLEGREREEKERDLIGDRDYSCWPENHWDIKSTELRRLHYQMHGKLEVMDKVEEPSDDQQSDDLSLSIPLPPTPASEKDDRSSSRGSLYAPRQSELNELRQQADVYRSRMKECRSQTDMLIAQRNALDRRLQELSDRTTVATPSSNLHLLDQLTAQQEKNQVALMRLQQQMHAVSQPSELPQSDDFLLKEINLMRLRYLQGGGNNPEILLHIAGMEKDAIALAQKNGDATARHRKDRDNFKSVNERLLAVELENQRLQDELVSLHETNTDMMQRDTVHDNDSMRLLEKQQEQFLQDLQSLENEVDIANHRTKLEMLKKKMDELEKDADAAAPQAADLSVCTTRPTVGSLIPPAAASSYNPTTGFVVFYDFVGGLELSYSGIRLTSSLYRGTTVFGHPAALYASATVSDHTLGVVAVFGAKQPILPCPATNDVALILELQTAVSDGQTPVTRAWCRVSVFNEAGCIMAGCWRLPLRVPPVDLLPSTPEAFTHKYGSVEAFVRIVSEVDSEVQSMVRVSPADRSRYRYPSNHC